MTQFTPSSGVQGTETEQNEDMTNTNSVRKYGRTYRCVIVRTTPTRHLVRFTQVSGRTVERWVSHNEVTA